jgi:hypothetical protein
VTLQKAHNCLRVLGRGNIRIGWILSSSRALIYFSRIIPKYVTVDRHNWGFSLEILDPLSAKKFSEDSVAHEKTGSVIS